MAGAAHRASGNAPAPEVHEMSDEEARALTELLAPRIRQARRGERLSRSVGDIARALREEAVAKMRKPD